MRFAQEMAFYSAYHQEKRNIWIHVVGVPTITFSLLVPLSLIPLFQIQGFTITLAMAFTALVLLYYLTLDIPLGIVTSVVFLTILYFANLISQSLETKEIWIVFATGQILGWGAQVYGHVVFEKNRPALLDNLFQALVSAPLFVVADVCFALGFRKELEEGVKKVLRERGQWREYAH